MAHKPRSLLLAALVVVACCAAPSNAQAPSRLQPALTWRTLAAATNRTTATAAPVTLPPVSTPTIDATASKPAVTCPPKGFGPVKDLNISEYISTPWYVQAQAPLIYQPVSQLYCVRAIYEPLNPRNPLDGLKVMNQAREDSVNGRVVGTSMGQGPTLTAKVAPATTTSPQLPSRLTVGFTLPFMGGQLAPGPYWIVAVGENADGGYDWAIISGGAPEIKGESGLCKASANGQEVNGSGLWLFSRKPIDPGNTKVMLAKLEELGLDPSVLVDVKQEGCSYV